MAAHIFNAPPVFLIIITAAGYAIATVGMKSLATSISPLGYIILLAGVGMFICAEIALLRQSNLAAAYIGIMAAETLLIVVYAFSIGEMLNFKQSLGAGLVLAGFATLTATA